MPLAAHADAPRVIGYGCGVTAVADGILANPGSYSATLYGGPIAVADLPMVDDTTTPPTITFDTTGNPASGAIDCALQVHGTGTYAEPDATPSVPASGSAVAYRSPIVVPLVAANSDPVWMCTTLRLTDAQGDSETLYLDDATGEFSTDETTATCALVTSQQLPPQEACDEIPRLCSSGVGGGILFSNQQSWSI